MELIRSVLVGNGEARVMVRFICRYALKENIFNPWCRTDDGGCANGLVEMTNYQLIKETDAETVGYLRSR